MCRTQWENCSECVKNYDRCWCSKSNWDEGLLEVETPNGHSDNPNANQLKPMNVTVIPIRQPPPGWVEFRRCVTKQNNTNECKDLREENPIEKLIIRGIRSITTKEFEEM